MQICLITFLVRVGSEYQPCPQRWRVPAETARSEAEVVRSCIHDLRASIGSLAPSSPTVHERAESSELRPADPLKQKYGSVFGFRGTRPRLPACSCSRAKRKLRTPNSPPRALGRTFETSKNGRAGLESPLRPRRLFLSALSSFRVGASGSPSSPPFRPHSAIPQVPYRHIQSLAVANHGVLCQLAFARPRVSAALEMTNPVRSSTARPEYGPAARWPILAQVR